MTLEAFASIGEIVSAIGVIVSLVYLSAQIKDSAAASRQNAAHSVIAAQSSMLSAITESTEASRILLQGLEEPSALKPDEKLRFYALLRQFLIFWDEMYHLQINGQIEAWTENFMGAPMSDILATPGGNEYVSVRKHWYSPEFQSHLDERLRSSEGDRFLRPYTK